MFHASRSEVRQPLKFAEHASRLSIRLEKPMLRPQMSHRGARLPHSAQSHVPLD